jgi:hypothetical protein
MGISLKELLTAFGYLFFIFANLASLVIVDYGVQINFGYAVSMGIYFEGISAALLLAFCIRNKLWDTMKNKKIISFLSGILLIFVCGFSVFHNLHLIMWKMGYPIDEAMIKSGVLNSFWVWICLTIFLPVTSTLGLIEFPRCFLKNRHA